MSVFGSSGFHGDTAGGISSTKLIATVPAFSYISKIDIQGYINVAIAQVTAASGGFANYNVAAGIQFGNQGYTVVNITNGDAGGASWYSWGNLIPPTLANQDIPGASPQTFMQEIGFPLSISLRQYMYCKVATDIYCVVGIDTAKTYQPSFQTFYTFNVEWAQFP